jgi:Mn2+/Fe2+ NRAMP family transporter
MITEAPPERTQVRNAPTDFFGVLKQLGPGLIISAVIVGSGELIVTPKLGAAEGFHLLWFIILGCFIKVFVQIELGRFAVSKGMTTLEAMNLMPGPRFIVSWLLWLWLLMYLALIFQVAGMIGGLASVFSLAGAPLSETMLAIVTGLSCAILLVVGRYRLVEVISTALVVIFTLTTLVAVGAVQSTPYAISGAQIAEGLKFHLPSTFTTAFAAFGIIGVGASELIYYPYWCLEKGYAKSVGPLDHTATWVERAKGWMRILKIDAWLSFAIYTTATIAFYLLGASVLHAKGLVVADEKMIPTLSFMYRETFGEWSYWLFLLGAFAVLYSTVFGATASNARLLADALSIFRITKYPTPADRARMVKLACVFLPVAFTTVFLLVGQPVSLVFVGALAQGLMLPFLAYAALYFRLQHTHPSLVQGQLWTFFLWFAAVAMSAVGLYQVVTTVAKILKNV